MPVEHVKCLEHSEGSITSNAVGLAINIGPARRDIRPDHEAEALDQAIIAAAAAAYMRQILGNARGLRAADHRDANGLTVKVEAAANPVYGIRRVTIPPAEIKAPLVGMAFLVQAIEQR